MYPITMVSLPCLKPTCSTQGVSPAQAPQRPASPPTQGRAWGREMFFRKPTAELSVSSHSKEKNSGQEILYIHGGTGSRRQSCSASMKGTSYFLTWKVTRKEKGPRRAYLGLLLGAPAGTSVSRTSGGAGKKSGFGQRASVSQERLGEEIKYVYLKDNYSH